MHSTAHLIDLTLLRPNATKEEILSLCHIAVSKKIAAVCVSPFYISFVKKELINTGVKTCTVIGFPNGNHTTKNKIAELKEAIDNGAEEIDFVINRHMVSNGDFNDIKIEASYLIDLCKQKNVVSKWIIETRCLSYEEIQQICEIANEIKPDFVKTSTGYFGGCTLEDVTLLRKLLYPAIKIKASGGIKTLDFALSLTPAGADRLGTSCIDVAI
jgi:deoxyribose-phosphate aldolase